MGRASAILCCVLMLLAGSARGEVLTINITAEITGIDDDYNLLMGSLNVGDILTGSYTYNSATPDSNPDIGVGDYEHYSFPYGIYLSGGGFVFQTDPANVNFLVGLVNDYQGAYDYEDHYLLRSYNNLSLYEGISVDHISWQLDDNSGTAISSDALPLTAPVLSDWPDSTYGLMITGLRMPLILKEGFGIQANVTSAELVPEPATILLLCLGGLALCNRRAA